MSDFYLYFFFTLRYVTYISITFVLFHSDVIFFLFCNAVIYWTFCQCQNILLCPATPLNVVNHCCTRLSSSKSLFPKFLNYPVKLVYLFTMENSFDRAQNCSDPICSLFKAFFFPSVISHENWHFNVKSFFFFHVGK